jgi:P-type Ca2+ transporter type 2C
MVLRMCSRYYNGCGILKDLDNGSMLKFESIIQGMAASSICCIALAYTKVANKELGDEEDNFKMVVKENDLTLLGHVGIKDPCPPWVKTAMEACQHAGVNIKMITALVINFVAAISTNEDIFGVMSKVSLSGHLFDQFLINEALDIIEAAGGSFHLVNCHVGQNFDDISCSMLEESLSDVGKARH